jgi:hypothetical protein
MEHEKRESIEQIFEDHGGEEAIIDADDTGMIQEQRVTVESEIDEDLDGNLEQADEGRGGSTT